MSETNVSLIQDEDVLRRMWQQTEDFSKKKEIRTHMYKLREERLRNLYSPEPKAEAKGCEFTSSATHGASFADQTFQSMKSKEVRDAGSPPKEFTYRGQDLKEYSNAGWNVESQASTEDGGATRVKSLNATVEGRYDVEGGTGRFAAADSQRRAHTERRDDNSSFMRDETAANTATSDHLVRTSPDGTHHTSTTSSSTSSTVKQVSETRTEPTHARNTDTNIDERYTRTTNRSDMHTGDLVSRKVEYPDDNTKVIVETRCLPDGTRVTSTRREFRVPAQQTSYRNEHRARSDTRQTSSTSSRRTASADIVDTQRTRDDSDFRRQIRDYTTTDNDDRSTTNTQRTTERRELKTDRNVSDYSQTDNNTSETHRSTRVNNENVNRSTSDRSEYIRTHRGENERITEDIDQTDCSREVINTRDDRILKRNVEDIHRKKNTEERVQSVPRENKVEEVVERKITSDRYQTTYQTDYQQRKVSEDLSPTHQAWASTLRSDTPSTTHPSTRASSPGSRTFQSSTSSLRSSVSPDKYRKPSSRGGSPSKIDRSSPTRTVTSDRFADTSYSTYSRTEKKTDKYTSPERRPPAGQRPSTSPEKRQQAFRPSESPERKPDGVRSSPTRTTPAYLPTRPRHSPDKLVQSKHPRAPSPSRTYTPDSVKYSEASPERDVGYRRSPEPSTSPDRKPGYMRPTAASQPTSDTRKSPSQHTSTLSPDRKKVTKVVEDHYTFIDEETKVNIRNHNVRTDVKYETPGASDSNPSQKSHSPKRQTPNDSKSPPTPKSMTLQKDTITVTENEELYGRIDKTVEIIDVKETDDTKISKFVTKDSYSDTNVIKSEPSPMKYNTYDKKEPRKTITTEITTESIDDSVKYDSLTRDKFKKAPEPLSPTKKSPRNSTSPTKSPTKDIKYKNKTEFIRTEKNTKEVNKNTVSNNRPRQLTTPSSSPTRKPQAPEPEPSTGQSSPTTSVSGFVYFGSPQNERPLITDLDDVHDDVDKSNYVRPETLDVKPSPTPSKLPCRSPSPEQRPSLPKDSLPRKSSLKKPSAPLAEPTLTSPMEKPPTSFRISPTEDKPHVPEHKVTKIDQPVGSPAKPKPPLQRRETYDDRCRKILGMAEDTTTETDTKETRKNTKRPESGRSSQSISPCDSPVPKETSPFPEFSTITTKVTNTKTDVTDFISREIDENVKTAKTTNTKSPSRDIQNKDVPRRSSKSPEKSTQQTPIPATRSTSPTKPVPAERLSVSPTRKPSRDSPVKQSQSEAHPQDSSPTRRTPGKTTVFSTTTSAVTSDSVEDVTIVTSTNKTRSRILESPTRDVPTKSAKSPEKSPTRTTTRRAETEHDTFTKKHTITSISPTRKGPQNQPRGLSPTKSSPTRTPKKPELSPERKPISHTKELQPSNKKSSSPIRPYQEQPGYLKTTTSTITKHDTINTGNVQKTITSKRTDRKHSASSPAVSPTRKPSEPRTPSPDKMMRPSNVSKKFESSPERKPSHEQLPSSTKPIDKHPATKSPSRTSPEKIPGYMKTTTSTSSKFESTSVTDVHDTFTSVTDKKYTSRYTESPRSSPDRGTHIIRSESPSKSSPRNDKPSKKSSSPDHNPKEPTPTIPGYMRPTEAVMHKFDSTLVTDVEETITEQSDASDSDLFVSPDSAPKIPGYMRPTEAVIHRFDNNVATDVEETIISKTTSRKSPEPTDRDDIPIIRRSISPEHKPKDSTPKIPGYMRATEATIHKFDTTLITDVEETITSTLTERSDSPISDINVSSNSAPKIPGYMRPTEAVIHKYDSNLVTDVEEETVISKSKHRQSPEATDNKDSLSRGRSMSPDHKPKDSLPNTPGYMRPTEAVIHKFDSTVITDVEETLSTKTLHRKSPEPVERSANQDLNLKNSTPMTHGYMRPTEAVTHKFESTVVSEVDKTVRRISPDPTDYPNRRTSPERKIERASPAKDSPIKPFSLSPDRKSSHKSPSDKTHHLTKPMETIQLRTPSPIKKATTQVTDVTTDFILSEKEQEILNKVQRSLRKLSPDRKEKSPSPRSSRERTPNKSTLSLEDLDIITTSETEHTHKFTGENLSEVIEEHVTTKTKQPHKPTDKLKDQKAPSKPTSRNTSPTKKTPTTPAKSDSSPESPTKSRSISPKKPYTPFERPQSPKVSRVSGIKQREPLHSVLTRKPTPATIKIERIPSDTKRTNGVTKQTITVKSTTTSKTVTRPLSSPTRKTFDTEPKRTPMPKGIKEPTILRKETVIRTISDNSIKPKKSSPQQMRSKPEIQVSDMFSKLSKSQKPSSKLPIKPKSATALNTSLDEEDFIVDLQQSKSSRENSPDRICPTPVNFTEDVGTPRFPDEVSEPDDEYRRRTHQTIHETESVVDDIVEICEDEELFIKKTDRDIITENDDSVTSVTDKATKFTNKTESVKKPKDTFSVFKDTDRRVHSDYTTEDLKSDECLLSVSEKVNKFVKGPKDLKDKRSPTKRIVDDYDNNTIYQDDYTKLSVNDKAHLFIETAENIKVSKPKPAQKMERPDLSNVDESLKSDECLLSVSDKVNKFVKTAEQFLTETTEVGEKKIKEQHERIVKQVVDNKEDKIHDVITTVTSENIETIADIPHGLKTTPSKVRDPNSQKSKPSQRAPPVKITKLRSSEAVKKAKAMFENISSSQTKETNTTKTTKLTDIGVIKNTSKTDSTTVLHPSIEDISTNVTYVETEIISQTPNYKERPQSETRTRTHLDDKPRNSLNRLTPLSPEVPRSKSPMRHNVEVATTKSVLSRYPIANRAESPSYLPESPRPNSEADKQVPGYMKPTKTSHLKEETKVTEESEVSTRRGSGKFGVELRRTSVERSTVSSERRRSVDHHQPCIEDIYDLDLLEQMLEKVTGYEQRRRIRAQIRIAKKESEHVDTSNTYTKTVKQTTHVTSSPRPRSPAKSPEKSHKTTPQKTASPDRLKSTPQKVAPERNQTKTTPYMNGHAKEPVKNVNIMRPRPTSPEKQASKPVSMSPEKKRTESPSKTTQQKPNRFNEYASAYMKKVQLIETDKVKLPEIKTKKIKDTKQTVKHDKQENVQEFTSTTTKSISESKSSKDVIEIVQVNGKRPMSPERRQSPIRKHQSPERKAQSPERKTTLYERKAQSPERKTISERKAQSPERKTTISERKAQSPERLYQRTPSPDFKRPRADAAKETIIKTVYDIDKKVAKTRVQEEKPSWVTNRNLKKITSETRTFSTKKIETEKPKYRAVSPSKVIVKPTDVITSSYGPGPLDADGKPLFGIKALRNGATNFQVKGTVIRQEFHSRNGGEPEGTVSVTAYASQPEDLQQLLADQNVEPPSRLHGLSAVTTTKKFGGDTGNTYSNVHSKQERASLEQFTHSDRKVVKNNQIEDISFDNVDADERRGQTSERRREEKEVRKGQKMERKEDKKTVRQSSVKSLTEKFIKSSNDTGKVDRSSYPKAGLILRTTTARDSISSDDAPGVMRTDSDHSLNDEAFEQVESTRTIRTRTEGNQPGRTRTTTTDASHPGRTRTTVTETSNQPGRTTRTVRTTTVVQEPVVTSVTRTEQSFLDSNTKVTGVQDILTRMKNADIVIQEGDSSEEAEARALLNKFLGATVLMAGMQGYVNEEPTGKVHIQESSVRSSGAGNRVTSSTRIEEIDLEHCWDEQLLRKLLDECTDYEQRRRLRARIRSLMAEQEACANAVTEALGCAATETRRGEGDGVDAELREEEEVTVSSSVRRDSTETSVSSSTTTKTSKVVESMTRSAPKPVSPFAKFRQLEKQNSTNSPNSPKTPQSPGSPSQPFFKFTDPALQTSALTIKERLLQWCRDKTRDYENVKLENFSTSWADGLAFCALVHHFLPDAFDYSKLTADKRRHNFTLAFKVADEKAGIYPLLDVDDMVTMRKPDWKCVFTYVQSIHRRFKDER